MLNMKNNFNSGYSLMVTCVYLGLSKSQFFRTNSRVCHGLSFFQTRSTYTPNMLTFPSFLVPANTGLSLFFVT